MTFNDVTKDSAFYTSTSRFVTWLGAFSKERQGLWLPKDDVKDPSPLPLLFLRDIHSKFLSNYNCKEASSQSQVNVGSSGGLRFQDGVFQQEETAPLSIPQLLRWDSRGGTRSGARVPGLEMPWIPGTTLL